MVDFLRFGTNVCVCKTPNSYTHTRTYNNMLSSCFFPLCLCVCFCMINYVVTLLSSNYNTRRRPRILLRYTHTYTVLSLPLLHIFARLLLLLCVFIIHFFITYTVVCNTMRALPSLHHIRDTPPPAYPPLYSLRASHTLLFFFLLLVFLFHFHFITRVTHTSLFLFSYPFKYFFPSFLLYVCLCV